MDVVRSWRTGRNDGDVRMMVDVLVAHSRLVQSSFNKGLIHSTEIYINIKLL